MKLRNFVSTIALTMVLTACGDNGNNEEAAVVDNAALATEIAMNTIIVDTHIDVPYRLYGQMDEDGTWIDVGYATEGGDLDYPRSVAGGLNAPFMSVYLPAETEAAGTATKIADELIDMVERIANENPKKYAIATSTADVEAHFAAGLISLPMGMENGAPIAGSMENLQHFYDRGIRYITLTHGKANHISDSSYDPERPHGGLSDFGKELVPAMNNIGIMIDISHVSDEAFWDAIKISKVPVIASHSSARHFTPGFERNMNDDMIKGLGDNGGVIHINYGSSFLTEEANQYRPNIAKAYTADLEAKGVEGTDELRDAFVKEYTTKHPYPYATLDQTLDHFDHVVKLVGIDHVGIGSDYDGVGDSLPVGLKDVASYPTLIKGLLDRGYSEEDVKKVLSGNLMRVWKAVEVYAAAN
jgi:membrane dipeptidase